MATDETKNSAVESWPKWVTALLLAYTIAAPTIAVSLGNNGGAAILAAAGAAALLLTRLHDITKFTLFGLKAELREAIGDAQATTEQLRKLAVSLAEPSLDYMAMHGVALKELSFGTQYANKQKIITALRELKVHDEKIREISSLWIEVTLRKLSNVIVQKLMAIDQTAANGFAQKIRLDDGNAATPDAIRAYFQKSNITDPEILELLDDYTHLAQTGEVKRPKVITVGVQP